MAEAETFDYIVVGAGSGGLRAGQPADRVGPASRAAAGGGRRRIAISGSMCRSATASCSPTPRELALQFRAGAGARQPPDHPAARQGAGRIELDQRPALYPRPAEDFDHWRQLGNAGWSFADVLPYFRRAEDQERGADDLHGVGGPLAVSTM